MNKADAFELLPSIDPEVRNQFIDEDQPNDLVDVVRTLATSRTPGWLSYYVQEHEVKTNLGAALRELLDDETINSVAKDYAEAENPVINLQGPGASNWMSEDPMGPVRERFEQKQEEIATELVDAYASVFDEMRWFQDEDFRDWLHEEFKREVSYVAWAVYEKRAAEAGSENPTKKAAEWCVERTRVYELESTIRTFEVRDEPDKEYLEVDFNDEMPSGNPVHVPLTESDNAVQSPPLPKRDINIMEHVDEGDLPGM